MVSGVVLFVSPPGRVANWGNWRMIGLTKHEWTGVHTWFAAVFVVTAVFHLVFNLRPLMNYFQGSADPQAGVAVGMGGGAGRFVSGCSWVRNPASLRFQPCSISGSA